MAAGHAGLQLSFGSTGDCFDNAAMETFWATLKREIAVDIAQPRSPTSADFVELTKLLEALLHEEVHKARAARVEAV